MGSNVGLGGEYMWGYRGEREKTDGKGGMKTVEKLGGSGGGGEKIRKEGGGHWTHWMEEDGCWSG